MALYLPLAPQPRNRPSCHAPHCAVLGAPRVPQCGGGGVWGDRIKSPACFRAFDGVSGNALGRGRALGRAWWWCHWLRRPGAARSRLAIRLLQPPYCRRMPRIAVTDEHWPSARRDPDSLVVSELTGDILEPAIASLPRKSGVATKVPGCRHRVSKSTLLGHV